MEEGMATHSSILAWRFPWTEKPGRLQSMGSQRVGHGWSDLACKYILEEASTQKKSWVEFQISFQVNCSFLIYYFPSFNLSSAFFFLLTDLFLYFLHSTPTSISSLFLPQFLLFVVQSLGHVWLFVTPWTVAHEAPMSFTISRSLFKLMSIESVMPSNQLILSRPLLLLPSIFPRVRVFYNELALHIRWTKYWNFSFSISPSNEYPGLISFRMDWLNLLAVQETLKSLL